MKTDKNTWLCVFGGFAVGVVNGMLGAGGGMIAVPILTSLLGDRKSAHINSVALILPLCIISACVYIFSGQIETSGNLMILIPFGLIGALLGTYIMKKISANVLRKIFSVLLIYAGVRMLLA